MGNGVFFVRGQLGAGFCQARWQKDRVVAETVRTSRAEGNAAFQYALGLQQYPVGLGKAEGADESGGSLFGGDGFHHIQQFVYIGTVNFRLRLVFRFPAGKSCRIYARCAVEGIDD